MKVSHISSNEKVSIGNIERFSILGCHLCIDLCSRLRARSTSARLIPRLEAISEGDRPWADISAICTFIFGFLGCSGSGGGALSFFAFFLSAVSGLISGCFLPLAVVCAAAVVSCGVVSFGVVSGNNTSHHRSNTPFVCFLNRQDSCHLPFGNGSNAVA